jgi:hypothetical protein
MTRNAFLLILTLTNLAQFLQTTRNDGQLTRESRGSRQLPGRMRWRRRRRPVATACYRRRAAALTWRPRVGKIMGDGMVAPSSSLRSWALEPRPYSVLKPRDGRLDGLDRWIWAILEGYVGLDRAFFAPSASFCQPARDWLFFSLRTRNSCVYTWRKKGSQIKIARNCRLSFLSFQKGMECTARASFANVQCNFFNCD